MSVSVSKLVKSAIGFFIVFCAVNTLRVFKLIKEVLS